jgi:hypothetical protein
MICVANRGRESTDTVRLARPRNAAPHSGAVCYVEGECRSVNRFRLVLNCSLLERRTVTQLFSPVRRFVRVHHARLQGGALPLWLL